MQTAPYARASVQLLPDDEITAAYYSTATTELMVSHTHTHTYKLAQTCTNTHTHTHTHTEPYAHTIETHAHTHTHTHTRTHTHITSRAHIYKDTCAVDVIFAHTCAYTLSLTHKDTRAHTHLSLSLSFSVYLHHPHGPRRIGRIRR